MYNILIFNGSNPARVAQNEIGCPVVRGYNNNKMLSPADTKRGDSVTDKLNYNNTPTPLLETRQCDLY